MGARQCGKTTLAKDLNVANCIYRTLDSEQQLEAALTDPEGFVDHGDELMIIDEVHRSPALIRAIKKNVDENTQYGRFLITGSANIRTLPTVTESLAGRVSRIRLRTLSMGEICGTSPTFVEQAITGAFSETMAATGKPYTKADYLQLALTGGYPEPRILPAKQAKTWYRAYIEKLVEHDLNYIINIRRKDDMQQLLALLASWSTKIINIEAIGAPLSIKRPTVESYINALETLYLIDRVPAWRKTDYAIARKKDKLFVSDTGLLSAILHWTFDKVQFDSDCNGKLIENFVYQQLVSVINASIDTYYIYHYRDGAKREIDFLVKNMNGDILGIEVKAGSVVKKEHFRHLVWFRDNLVKHTNFKGIVLYTGEHIIPFGKDLWAVPISALWG